jgi:hypothetical protein
MLITLIFIVVSVIVILAHLQFVMYRAAVSRLEQLSTHPAILVGIGDLETAANIKFVSERERLRMSYIWVPLGYLAIACVMTLWFLIATASAVPTAVGAIAALIISALITSVFRYDFTQDWFIASAKIVLAASTKAEQTTKDALIAQVLAPPPLKNTTDQ